MSYNFNELDPRLVEGIVPEMRYNSSQAAQILGCSSSLVIKLCDRSYLDKGHIDPRHYNDFLHNRKYSDAEVARKLNVSHTTIYFIRKCGILEESPLRHVTRIPGWSLIDFIKNNTSNVNANLQFFSTKRIVRIPGWSLIDFLKNDKSFR